MSRPNNRVYWDSCVFVSYLDADPHRIDTIEQIIDDIASDNQQVIVTSQLSLVEVAFVETEKVSGVLNQDIVDRIEGLWSDHHVLEIVELNPLVARRARELIRLAITDGRRLKPADAIHLATAEWVAASEFHTYDDKLKGYADMIGMPISAPHVPQPRIPGT